MSEPVFKILLQGVDQNASTSVDKVVDRLNRAKEATRKWNDERSKMAKQDRIEKFRQLSDEDKLLRLRERQVQIERRLLTATAQGNQLRIAALRLSASRNQRELGSLGVRGGGGASGGSAVAGGAVFGAASRFLAPAAIFGAMASAARSALQFADETSDLAEQMGITREQVVQITKAAGAAGVNVRQVIGGLSTLSAARSAALGGDVKAQALFSRYGGNPSESNILTLAQSIAGSMGAGGMGAGDRGAMGQLFGRRPEAIIAALRSIQSIGNVEDDLRKLDEANAKIEGFWNGVKMAMVKTGAAIISAGEYAMRADRASTGALGGRGGIGFGTFTPAVKGFTEGLGFGAKRRAEDTVLSTSASVAKAATPPPQITGSIPQADSLARMGLYIGGGPNSTAGIMRQQLSELKAIKDASRATTQSIRNI